MKTRSFGIHKTGGINSTHNEDFSLVNMANNASSARASLDSPHADIAKTINYALQLCGMSSLTFREYQKSALTAFLKDCTDIFIAQPTGSGKTLVYQLAPYAYEYVRAKAERRQPDGFNCNWYAVVISPLISLMEDLAARLKNLGASFTNLGDRHRAIEEKEAFDVSKLGTFVLGSPEIFLDDPKVQTFLKESKDKIIGIFVDESHCVAKWYVLCLSDDYQH